ncbi:MAG TPA: M48 family metalloprotease [Tepidisphaeraceae bacterium]|nr:M48 family metalloprotease [Tepidisphaeraceae bacterium]
MNLIASNPRSSLFRPRRGMLNLRVIIALVIALFGLIGYLGKRSTNPVTGETQYVSLDPKQEIALGLQAAPRMAEQMGGVLPASDPRAATVARVGAKLVQRSEAGKPESPYAQNFRFYLLGDPKTINAFALPGGPIFITAALYEKLENEAQLAGVLGHEIGHVVNRHAAEHMAKGQLGGMLATAVGVGASDNRGRGFGTAIAAQAANQVIQLRFGRQDETESDTYGLRYMIEAGYDPRQMIGVMEILRDASQGRRGGGWSILQSHPNPELRLEQIAAMIKQMYPGGVPATLTEGEPLPR